MVRGRGLQFCQPLREQLRLMCVNCVCFEGLPRLRRAPATPQKISDDRVENENGGAREAHDGSSQSSAC